MVVTEALARGVPVLASDVGGVSEALGRDADGLPPGLLVPTGDVASLARAVRDWLERRVSAGSAPRLGRQATSDVDRLGRHGSALVTCVLEEVAA